MHAWLHACMRTALKSSRRPPRDSFDKLEKEPLQVRIPVGIKRAFKSHAALRGMEPNALFVEVWEHYEQTSPNREQVER